MEHGQIRRRWHQQATPDRRFDVPQWRRSDEASTDEGRESAVRARVEADSALATDLRLPAQPAAVVDGPGGTRELIESPSPEEIIAAVDEVS